MKSCRKVVLVTIPFRDIGPIMLQAFSQHHTTFHDERKGASNICRFLDAHNSIGISKSATMLT
jgi:hypothetical protein